MPRCTQKDEKLMVELLRGAYNMEIKIVSLCDLKNEVADIDRRLQKDLYLNKDISLDFKKMLRGAT